jgi:four helix bundle suffix protein
MIQAARSGRQNIAEGSRASGTSKKTEIKLVNVARASLEELLLDFEDFLRQRKMEVWKKEDADALKARAFLRSLDLTDRTDGTDHQPDRKDLSDRTLNDPERFANLMLCLIHQTNYLLDCQIKVLEKDLLEKGGFTENLYHKRREYRGF